MSKKIKPRERDAILQSLRAGVVPRVGLQHIQVGRKDEISAIIDDLNRVEGGGGFIRFVIGRFGSGKSFFLNLARIVALEKKFVVVQADITPDRRLYSRQGYAQGLYAELMQNMATRSKPLGGAISSIVERWIADIDHEVRHAGGDHQEVATEMHKRLRPLQDHVSGYDFANVLIKYLEGFHDHNDSLIDSSLRWLRGEYSTKSEARRDLGVRSIIDDQSIYDYLKLSAIFAQMAGYRGLLVNIDEMGVLSHRLNNAQARNQNYEMILRILNDCLQGNVSGIGFLFAGTDSFLEDNRRGLYSYDALATRLADHTFAVDGLKDFSGPIIHLENLSQEDLYVLLHNIRHVFARGEKEKYPVPDDALKDFMFHCSKTLGSDYYRTPRDSVKGFVGLLSVLEQNPGTDWRSLLKSTQINKTSDPETSTKPDLPGARDDDLATFKL